MNLNLGGGEGGAVRWEGMHASTCNGENFDMNELWSVESCCAPHKSRLNTPRAPSVQGVPSGVFCQCVQPVYLVPTQLDPARARGLTDTPQCTPHHRRHT